MPAATMPAAPRAQADTQTRLRELMLHIATHEQDNRRFGATKLNKILFYCDFLWYLRTGDSITGATYQKLDHGPAPRELLPARASLIKEKAARMERRPMALPYRAQTRLVPTRNADLSVFSSEEIAFVDQVMGSLRDASAEVASLMSHRHLGWQLADFREDIPYFTALLCDNVALPSDIERGIELARERGWTTESMSA